MSNDITMCHPQLQELANKLIQKCDEQGLKIKLTECFRSVYEQDLLYAKGRTLSGSKVTNAKGSSYSSMHQWGIAFDICRNDGNGAYDDFDGFFTKVSVVGKELGLEWGGDWKSIKDKPHYQLKDWGSTPSELKKKYKNPDKFKKSWYNVNKTQQKNVNNKCNPKVLKFQQCVNADGFAHLTEDGVFGTNTDAVAKMTLVQLGMHSWMVAFVQMSVGAKVDGVFGKGTLKLVKKYQTNHGLENDGVVGYQTLKSMMS